MREIDSEPYVVLCYRYRIYSAEIYVHVSTKAGIYTSDKCVTRIQSITYVPKTLVFTSFCTGLPAVAFRAV